MEEELAWAAAGLSDGAGGGEAGGRAGWGRAAAWECLGVGGVVLGAVTAEERE